MRTTRRISIVRTLVAAALASLATVLALPAGGSAVTQARPDNTAEPRITGAATVGSTLNATQGSWANAPTELSYQWVRCPRSGGLPTGADCATIGGATTTSYVVSTGDVDRRLRVRVTAANAEGSATAASNATPRITDPGAGRPVNAQPPTVSGTPSQGQTLRVTPGTWNGRQPITFTFNWLRCDAAGNNCIQQPGFNDDAYVVREGDVGKTMRARVNARNSRGEASRLTAQTTIVTGPQGPPASSRCRTARSRSRRRAFRRTCVWSSTRRRSRTNPVRSRIAPFPARVKVKGHARLRRPRRPRLLPLDAARHPQRAGSANRSGRLAAADGDAGAGLPGASARIRGAVLREGVSPGRSRARRCRRDRLVQVPLGR